MTTFLQFPRQLLSRRHGSRIMGMPSFIRNGVASTDTPTVPVKCRPVRVLPQRRLPVSRRNNKFRLVTSLLGHSSIDQPLRHRQRLQPLVLYSTFDCLCSLLLHCMRWSFIDSFDPVSRPVACLEVSICIRLLRSLSPQPITVTHLPGQLSRLECSVSAYTCSLENWTCGG